MFLLHVTIPMVSRLHSPIQRRVEVDTTSPENISQFLEYVWRSGQYEQRLSLTRPVLIPLNPVKLDQSVAK